MSGKPGTFGSGAGNGKIPSDPGADGAWGMPLLGDQRYGSEESREVSMQLGIRTIRLQAVKLAFCHPTSGKRVCYELTDKLYALKVNLRFRG